jgi:hypothetical protein
MPEPDDRGPEANRPLSKSANPWDDPGLPMDPAPDATAGDTDLFGVPIQKDLFGQPMIERGRKK